MNLRKGLTSFLLFAGIAASTGLLAIVLGIPGCGGGGSPNGTKCSQCGDTDGPCDNPQRLGRVCWDTGEECSEDLDCLNKSGGLGQPCIKVGACNQSGGLCFQDADCRTDTASSDTCDIIDEGGQCSVSGERCDVVGGRQECTTNLCVWENLQCLRKIGSAERICFDVNLANTPERQCGTKFTLFVPVSATTTTTSSTASTSSTTATSTTTSTTS